MDAEKNQGNMKQVSIDVAMSAASLKQQIWEVWTAPFIPLPDGGKLRCPMMI